MVFNNSLYSCTFFTFDARDTSSAASGKALNISAASGKTLNIVAHEDDDLLFLSPDLLHAIQSGRNVRTIFVTAGDAGGNARYWKGREDGMQAAYAQVCGVANSWSQTDAGIAGHPIPVFTLTGYPSVSLAFLRLPDGNVDGGGFASTGYESLQKLWTDSISTIRAVNGSSSYTKTALINTLTSLMSSFQPDQVNMQDYIGAFGDGDHSDHHATAYLVQSALQGYATPYSFTGYEDYNTSSRAANVTGSDLTAKQNAFYTYGQYDGNACDSAASCAGSNYELWLQRQYTVGSGTGGGSTNIALFATATASSENTSTSQTANKAIDGVIDGYPGDYTKEWATVGGGAGSWLKLTWTSPQTVSRIVLYDRPNTDDQITGGNIQFSDGSSVPVGTLNNNGAAVIISFSTRTITSLQLNITSVSASTINVGLAEIQVYGS
jgi:LmbE family N-acetylglucosaminyl deacetylase